MKLYPLLYVLLAIASITTSCLPVSAQTSQKEVLLPTSKVISLITLKLGRLLFVAVLSIVVQDQELTIEFLTALREEKELFRTMS
jgi:hypothetical protein